MKKFLFLLLSAFVFAQADTLEPCEKFTPWFTGSLISPDPIVVPRGEFELDAYFYLDVNSGEYDGDWKYHKTPTFYTFSVNPLLYIGLTSWMDLEIFPQYSVSWSEGQTSSGFNDFTTGLGFTAYSSDEEGWFPGIKLSIQEIFPTGKYDQLDPTKIYTDQMGYGSYTTLFGIVFYKIYPLTEKHSMSFTLSGQYGVSAKTHVRGLNAFGGGRGTNGWIDPGNTLQVVCSFEFNLTQHWSLAFDTVWTSSDSSHFSGKPGLDGHGNLNVLSSPSSETLSFAPALEYGFSENLGLIAGGWFSATGRNSDQFADFVLNLYYHY